jgi:hypothetical protein
MSFPTLAKSYEGLWIVKVERKSLGVSLGTVISLETSVPSTWSNTLESSGDEEVDMSVAEWS